MLSIIYVNSYTLKGTYDARVSNFRIETREARALQLAWEALTAANTSGYYVRHVPEDPPFNRQLSYIRVLNSASTSVELADLQPGTRYTISIWGFSVDGNNNWMVTSDNNTITATTEEFSKCVGAVCIHVGTKVSANIAMCLCLLVPKICDVVAVASTTQ